MCLSASAMSAEFGRGEVQCASWSKNKNKLLAVVLLGRSEPPEFIFDGSQGLGRLPNGSLGRSTSENKLPPKIIGDLPRYSPSVGEIGSLERFLL